MHFYGLYFILQVTIIFAIALSPVGAAQHELVVTNTRDSGEGSLRQALIDAHTLDAPSSISFDPEIFAEPKTIALASSLPEISVNLTLDGYIPDRLWQATGVTLSMSGQDRVLIVRQTGRLTLRFLTVAEGAADEGGGMVNFGTLIIEGVTFLDNNAKQHGGALANFAKANIINSTFISNSAGTSGGGIANLGGSLTVTNSTFTENAAPQGGGVANEGSLLVRNTILANSSHSDCSNTGQLDPQSTHNLIVTNDGCGSPLLSVDPKLGDLAYFNGPTRTIAIGGGSPVINMGDNAAALGENGEPLVWDQRGNGDPRYVNGFTDLGAFERQANPHLVVDTLEDSILMGCTRAPNDCPLRAAIAIANASPGFDTITFAPQVFAEPQTLVLKRPLPEISADLVLDASGSSEVKVSVKGGGDVFNAASGVDVRRVGVHSE